MHIAVAAALLAGHVLALPQGFDWAAIEDPALAPVPTADIPVIATAAKAQATTLTFASALAASSIASAVLADPTDTSLKVKRDDSKCTVQPTADDTAENFLANKAFSDASSGAATPAGYSLAFSNLQGSSQGVYGYMGYSILSSYDTLTCSKRCDAINGCQSFNIYYERDGSVMPAEGCTNPPSATLIKCVYYGGPVTASTATNVGQYQDDFHVVIAGSNGYVNNSIATPTGYSAAVPLGNAAIDALLDCAGGYTYMGVKIFTSGPFDASLCAAACSATSDYNRQHPSQDGTVQTCLFFNTYVLYNNSQAVGQYCSMYNETWPASYATNVGQYRGDDHFTIGYSYAFSNATATAQGLDEPSTCANKASP